MVEWSSSFARSGWWVHGNIVPNEKLAQKVYLSVIFQRNLWSRFCVSDFVKYSLKRQSIAKSNVLKATVGRTVSRWWYLYYEHWFQPRNTFSQERQEWTQYPWGPSVSRQSYNAVHFSFVNRNDQDSEDKTKKNVLCASSFLREGRDQRWWGNGKGHFILFDHYFDEYLILMCGGEH